jgi:hypothetical protein
VISTLVLTTITVMAAPPPAVAAPLHPTAEEQAQLVAAKEAARDRDALARRLDVVAAVAGIAVAGCAAAFALRASRRRRPDRRLVAFGAGVATIGPPLFWAAGSALVTWTAPAEPDLVATVLVTGALCAAAGFAIAGSGLRPYGSRLRGSAVGLVLYGCVGLLWLFGWYLALGANGLSPARAAADPLAFGIVVLLWPLNLASSVGLFGG